MKGGRDVSVNEMRCPPLLFIKDESGNNEERDDQRDEMTIKTLIPHTLFGQMLTLTATAAIALRIAIYASPAHSSLQSRPELSTPLTAWRNREGVSPEETAHIQFRRAASYTITARIHTMEVYSIM